MNHPETGASSAFPVGMVAFVVLCLLVADGGLACAQEGMPGDQDASPATASRRRFLGDTRRALKAYDERLSALASRWLDQPGPNRSARDVVSLRIAAKMAEAGYLNAKLEREVAEIEVLEYKQGIYVQDLANVEGEIALAKADLKRGRDLVPFAPGDADKLWATLQLEARGHQLEAAELKKKALVEFTGPRLLKEIEARIAKAKLEERARKAAWEMARKQVEKAGKAAATPRPRTDHQGRILSLVAKAIPLEERIHAVLDRSTREANADTALEKEIHERLTELEAIVEEAEAASAASELDQIRSRLDRANRR